LEENELEYFASCLGGFEQLLADELKSYGIERVRPLGGGVAFFCAPILAYRACLWSRLASRVMLVVGRVDAADADQLYAGAYDVKWEEVLASGVSIAVKAQGTNGSLRNTRFTALKVKDAIADRLRDKRAMRPNVDKVSPHAAIDVRVRESRATLSLDFSGGALSHRDYLAEDDGEDAALNCMKAAGLLALAGWSTGGFHGCLFADPACRDGELLVEAASIACDRASGLQRDSWGFRGWAHHDEDAWQELVAQAQRRFVEGLGAVAGLSEEQAASTAPPNARHVRFLGMTSSSPQVSRARNQVRRAGLRQAVSVERSDQGALASFLKAGKRSVGQDASLLVASDLDAPARADAPADVLADESAFVKTCAAAPEGFRFAVAGGSEVPVRFGCEPVLSRTAGKGRMQTTLEVFDEPPRGGHRIEIADLEGGRPHVVDVLEPASEQFAARLRKVFKERRKWAARENVSCYRIYDSDLPDYALAIDWYTGAGDAQGNVYLHIAEYAPPASVDEGKARRRFTDALAIAPVVCGVRPDHVFAKRRVRGKGGSQYRNAGTRAYRTTVEEGGYRFEVDLSGRLDTGLFLDHRITRSLVREAAQGVRFLNLFAYTGSASVYAAGGGAASTTTVDLSSRYLEWAQRNMAANGFAGKAHSFEHADVLKWLTQARRSRMRYDLVFVDPPTFSNSKAMGKKTWDVQRDHVDLLVAVSRLLAEGGQAIFSCNLRSFKPNVEELERLGVMIDDISLDTIPVDFARTPKIHKCYRIRRK